jgi:dTDP-4-amino-4,6-dideoxygalactose transaminase
MLNTPFSPWPSFTAEEAEAVSRVLLSNRVNYWTGTEAREFEKEFAAWAGSRHAIALMNGTIALEVALKALGIGPGDEVVVTPRTFMASASCVVTMGATPVFADVDRDSGNISAATIEPVLTPRTKAIICVHLAGWPCDMHPLMALAHDRGIKVIEDCAQSHGAHYKGQPTGTHGHIAAWSFCQDKIITTGGEGGMLTTDDEAIWKAAWSYKDHGKSWDAVYQREHPPGFRWLHEGFGTNGRMIEVQAAVGRIQLRRMPQWSKARRRNGEAILRAARPHGVFRVPEMPADIVHAWYRCYVYVRPERLKSGWSRDRIVAEITSRGVPCFQGSCSEVYREKAFQSAGLAPPQRLANALELGDTSIAFLVHPTLTEDEMAKACAVIDQVGRDATR